MIAGSFIGILGCMITIFNPENLTVVMLSQVMKGIGQIPILGGVWALFPDTIEYGEWKTGVRNEGLLYSGGSLGQKMGIGIGTALTGWILDYGGYNGIQTMQSSSAINSIVWLFIYIPIIVSIIQIIVLYIYDIDKHYKQIASDLLKRKNLALHTTH